MAKPIKIEIIKAAIVLKLAITPVLGATPDPVLSAYAGTWTITRQNAPAGSKPDELRNQCESIGKFFACEQSVSGSVTGLLIFISTGQPKHYNTQTVLPEGRATGKGELVISGNSWTFNSIWNSGGKMLRYRTVNTFSDKNHIHFEQSESSDGTHWQVTGSGDDVRVTGGKR